MICEDILNSVLRRYGIAEPIEEDRGRVIVNRLRELCDQAPPDHTTANEKLTSAGLADRMEQTVSYRESAEDIGTEFS
jgi:hypothetical protein